jgi:integrase
MEAGKLRERSETVSDLMVRWLERCETKGLSPTTIREHRRIVAKNVFPVIGAMKLTKVRAADLDSLYAGMVNRGVSAATVRRTHAVIGAALKQATKWDLLDSNPALKASPPAVHKPEIVPPSGAEVRAMIEAAAEVEPMFAALLTLTAVTGARRGELCGLRWSDVDFEAGTLAIRRSVYERAGGGYGFKSTKTHAVGKIPLDPMAVAALENHRANVEALAEKLGLTIGPDAFMFSQGPRGLEPLHPDFLTKVVTRMSKRAGLNYHLHQLRRFAATQSFALGFDAPSVGTRLGHKDSSVTLRVYAHNLAHRDRELASALGDALAG